MTERVKIINERTLAEVYGTLKSTDLQLRRRNGEVQTQVRETYSNGDGAGILLYDPVAAVVVLVRQFRFAAFANGDDPDLLEVCAGKVEPGEDPLAAICREALEETGYQPAEVRRVLGGYSSPGVFMERLSLFVGRIDVTAPAAPGGGLQHEGEDIEIVTLPLGKALAMLETGGINDLKTVVLLQYAALHRLL
jgi:nudix-type nucleoside diphosphatase (YffH/AdpP family)